MSPIKSLPPPPPPAPPPPEGEAFVTPPDPPPVAAFTFAAVIFAPPPLLQAAVEESEGLSLRYRGIPNRLRRLSPFPRGCCRRRIFLDCQIISVLICATFFSLSPSYHISVAVSIPSCAAAEAAAASSPCKTQTASPADPNETKPTPG